MTIFAVYFSGTGNTKYAVEQLLLSFENSVMHSIEEPLDFITAAQPYDTILVAHPIYASDMPALMRDFLKRNRAMFSGKNLMTLVTQFLFSGDGGRLAYRLVRREIHQHIASMHINMPTNLDLKPLMPVKNGPDIADKIGRADRKLSLCVQRLHQGKPIKNGAGPLRCLGGFLSQRLWFRAFIFKRYRKRVRINPDQCTLCGQCVEHCPVGNLVMDGQRVTPQNKCILCYRCVNLCPVQAIAIMSKNDGKTQYQGPVLS